MAMDEESLEWKTIDSRRNVLLDKSDWTQLPDAGLSRRCTVEYRLWRKELRRVNTKNYSDRLEATKELHRLRDCKPEVEYAPDEEIAWEQNGSVISRIDFTNLVKEVLEEINMASEASQEPSERDMLDNVELGVARRIARKLVRDKYHEALGKVSPDTAILAMYNERLSQAVDLLSDTVETAPFLDVMAKVLEKSPDEVAESVLNKHSEMINKFYVIETDYLLALKRIQESDTIEEIKEAVDSYGH